MFSGPLFLFVALQTSWGQIVIEPPSLDFGERGQNERPHASLTLRNTGDEPVSIGQIKKSCDCISLSPRQLIQPIPARGSVEIQVAMGSWRAMGQLHKWIDIIPQDIRKPRIRVPVSMRVLSRFEMNPREIRFEGVVGGKKEVKSVVVKTRRGVSPVSFDLEIKEIRGRFNRSSNRYLRARVVPVPGGQEIVVELDSTHPEGLIAAELEASLNGKTLLVPIGGIMFAWIKVSPHYINFSRALEDDPASTTREVLFSSTDGTPFRILGIEARPHRKMDPSVRLEFSVTPLGGPSSAISTGENAAPAFLQRLTCRVFREGNNKKQATFFGTVTVRTDHPRKPVIELKYSGFFASPKK
jgi:hypothetical protein